MHNKRQVARASHRFQGKFHLLLFIAALSLSTASFSQQSSPAVVSAGGGTAKGSSISLDWTLGEVAAESIRSMQFLYTQGYHQPVLLVEKIKDKSDLSAKDYSVSVFPNPTTSVLIIQLHFISEAPLAVLLRSGNGKLLLKKTMPANSSQLQLNISGFANGAYFLQIQKGDGSILSNYNVIKAQ